MSLFKPEYIWLATGSKSGFKYEYLKPLRKHKIIGFPDKSEFNDWNNRAIELNSLGFNISISYWLEDTNYKKGTDLADVLIEEKLYNKKVTATVKQKQSLKPNLINTSTEIIIKKMALKNPELLNLIETFELTDANDTKIRI
jgi:hypothetical protein